MGFNQDDPKAGDVWLCDLGRNKEVNSSVQKGKRPWLVLNVRPSLDGKGNEFLVYIVVALTKVIKKENLPVHYVIEDWEKQGLKCRSMVIGEQQFSLRRAELIHLLTKVDVNTLYQARRVACINAGIDIDEALALYSHQVATKDAV